VAISAIIRGAGLAIVRVTSIFSEDKTISNTTKYLVITAVSLFVLLVIVYLTLWLRGSGSGPAPEVSAEQALTASKSSDRVKGAVKLVDAGKKGLPQMRRVLKESQDDQVRVVIIEGLGTARDFESMPAILDALEDPAPEVRAKAIDVVGRLLGIAGTGYDPNKSPQEQAKIIQGLRKEWKQLKSNPTALEAN